MVTHQTRIREVSKSNLVADQLAGGFFVVSLSPYLLSSETTAKGTGLEELAGKEDPVELDSSLAGLDFLPHPFDHCSSYS